MDLTPAAPDSIRGVGVDSVVERDPRRDVLQVTRGGSGLRLDDLNARVHVMHGRANRIHEVNAFAKNLFLNRAEVHDDADMAGTN